MKPRRRTQAERREDTRNEILAAASRVFAQRGFHGTSLDAVAEEAGFSRGAVYYNFADKDELFLALLDRRCAERAQDLREVFADADPEDLATTRDLTAVAARHALDALIADREWGALYLEFLAHSVRDEKFRRAFAERTDQMRAALQQVVVARAEPFADVLPMSPQQLAVVIDALGTGIWASHMLHGGTAVPPKLLSDALALLVDGVVARASSGVIGGTA